MFITFYDMAIWYAPFSAFSADFKVQLDETSAELPSAGRPWQQWALLKRPLHEVLAVAFPTTPGWDQEIGSQYAFWASEFSLKSWLFSIGCWISSFQHWRYDVRGDMCKSVTVRSVSKAKHKFTTILSLQHPKSTTPTTYLQRKSLKNREVWSPGNHCNPRNVELCAFAAQLIAHETAEAVCCFRSCLVD